LVARIIELQHADQRAIIDRRELKQPFPRAWDPLQKLHVQLHAMTRLCFLIPLPSLLVGLMLLIGRQPVHAMCAQHAMHGRPGNPEVVKPLQIRLINGRRRGESSRAV
jgi:hypothetical protein